MPINKMSGIEYEETNQKKKKLLWIGDDIRMSSGVSVSSRELLLGSIHKYDVVCIAGSISHPEKGKVINMDAATEQITGVKNSHLTIYPVDGYSNEDILFSIIEREKPDVLCMQTDPRFFIWLFALERQIRSKIPIVYWNIWDNTAYPRYNHAYYESCDSLFSISKQTYNINKWVLGYDKCFTMDGEFDKEGNPIPFQN